MIIRLVLLLVITAPLRLLASPVAPQPQPMLIRKISVAGPLSPGANTLLTVELSLKPGHMAYVDQFKIYSPTMGSFKNSKIKLSPIEKLADPHSKAGKVRELVKDEFTLETVIEIPESLSRLPSSVDLELSYQACTKKFCYTPKQLKLALPAK